MAGWRHAVHLKPWTQEQRIAVICDLYGGVLIEDMARKHRRTIREITHMLCELKILAWEAFNDFPPDEFDTALARQRH